MIDRPTYDRLRQERRTLAKKLESVDALLDAYRDDFEPRLVRKIDGEGRVRLRRIVPRQQEARESQAEPSEKLSDGERARIAAANYLLRNGNDPALTAKLTSVALGAGVEVGGKHPPATMAAHLSNSNGRFENVRGQGYRLTPEGVRHYVESSQDHENIEQDLLLATGSDGAGTPSDEVGDGVTPEPEHQSQPVTG